MTNWGIPDVHQSFVRTNNGTVKMLMWVEDPALRSVYAQQIQEHNANATDWFPDAGFDLMCPLGNHIVPGNAVSKKINFEVKISCWKNVDGPAGGEKNIGEGQVMPVTVLMMPRSSTGSKTPLRLANSVGVIDSGYRGPIIGVFDNLKCDDHLVSGKTRLCQLMTRTDMPITVKLVDSLEELGVVTRRGEGGFGSTGS